MRFSTLPSRMVCFLVVALAVLTVVLPARAQNSINVVLHYVKGEPSPGKLSYVVQAYVSVVDEAGNPIKELQTGDFQLNEDSKGVAVDSLRTAENEPIHLVLALDTSGTMYPYGIKAARQAALEFIDRLSSEDQLALMSFNNKVTREVEPTTDHQLVKDRLGKLDAVQNAGTCMYDAAYSSAQLAATFPTGQRAVILLTDGKDELLNGKTCSTHTIDDVINLASGGNMRVPIYTIGVRPGSDEKSLKRLAEMTGGIYQYAPTEQQVSETFTRLSDQLKAEYILKYISTAGPGAHSLIVQVKTSHGAGQDVRNFILPALPTSMSIVAPADGQEVNGKVKIIASVNTGGGEPVGQVRFYVDGTSIGAKNSMPYEYEWDTSSLSTGSRTVRVVAETAAGKELARSEIMVRVGVLPAAAPTLLTTQVAAVEATAAATATVAAEKMKSFFDQPVLAGSIVGGVGLVILIAAIFIIFRRRTAVVQNQPELYRPMPAPAKRSESPDMENKKPMGKFVPLEEATFQDYATIAGDLTFGQLPEEKAAGVICLLTIQTSDDQASINHLYSLNHLPARIGRSSECDILISKKDQPVSRFHAELNRVGKQITISEIASVDENGQQHLPRFHTFVNEVQIQGEPVVLKSGDIIRLGSRMTMKFDYCQPEPDADDHTIDSFRIDPDHTIDSFKE